MAAAWKKRGWDGIELLNLFLRSFFLTLALEYPVLLLFRVWNRHDLLLALPVNLLTNPAAVALHLLLRPFFPSLPLQALIENGRRSCRMEGLAGVRNGCPPSPAAVPVLQRILLERRPAPAASAALLNHMKRRDLYEKKGNLLLCLLCLLLPLLAAPLQMKADVIFEPENRF